MVNTLIELRNLTVDDNDQVPLVKTYQPCFRNLGDFTNHPFDLTLRLMANSAIEKRADDKKEKETAQTHVIQ